MNILSIIAGNSGTGKTYSLRDLGAEATVLNVERKALPFKSKGIVNVPINSTFKLFDALNRLVSNKDFKVVVIDSFSEFCDLLLAECKTKAKGYDIWNLYNTEIFHFFQICKALENKYVFVLGHTETLIDADGERIQRMKVKGKENEGMIEKNATCVFYSKTIRKQDTQGVDYKLITNTDGYLPAKTPFGMFKDFMIENNVGEIVKIYEQYYKSEEVSA
ncbi:MAG: AAA family ATPase [Leadbetterella sp.]